VGVERVALPPQHAFHDLDALVAEPRDAPAHDERVRIVRPDEQAPHSSLEQRDRASLAFAQLAQERFGDAAATARDALRLRKDSAAAHYVLGLTLVLEPSTRGEGMAHIEEAAQTLESARKALAVLRR
jgi:hypothetical protein